MKSYLGLDLDQPDSYCCVPTAAVTGCEACTGGRKKPEVHDLRRATGVEHPNGISYVAMTEAIEKVTGLKTYASFGLSETAIVKLANSGKPWLASIWTGTTRNTIRRTCYCSLGHTLFCPANNYKVFIPDGTVCDCEKKIKTRHSEFIYQDPGTFSQGFVRMSAELMFKAMKERTRQAGGSGCNVLVFPDTTDVYRKVVENHWVRQAPTTQSKKLRRVRIGDRPRHIKRFVIGEPWFRPDGGRSTAWAEYAAGGFGRPDHLGSFNVARP